MLITLQIETEKQKDIENAINILNYFRYSIDDETTEQEEDNEEDLDIYDGNGNKKKFKEL